MRTASLSRFIPSAFILPPSALARTRLLLLRNLVAQAVLLLPEFGRELRPEVRRLEHLADLHLLAAVERRPLEPLDRLLLRAALPQPEPRDQLLGLREGPVDHGALGPVEPHPRALGTGLQPLPGEHHARLHQFLVV